MLYNRMLIIEKRLSGLQYSLEIIHFKGSLTLAAWASTSFSLLLFFLFAFFLMTTMLYIMLYILHQKLDILDLSFNKLVL